MSVRQTQETAVEARLAANGMSDVQGHRAAAARQQPAEEAEVRPRGAMVVTLLYLLAVVAAWGYMYFSLLRAGQGAAS